MLPSSFHLLRLVSPCLSLFLFFIPFVPNPILNPPLLVCHHSVPQCFPVCPCSNSPTPLFYLLPTCLLVPPLLLSDLSFTFTLFLFFCPQRPSCLPSCHFFPISSPLVSQSQIPLCSPSPTSSLTKQ